MNEKTKRKKTDKMKLTAMIIFFGIVLTVYTLANYYIFRRGLQAIPAGSWMRSVYIASFIVLSMSYIAGRTFERFDTGGVAEFLTCVGAFWLAAMLYFFLSILIMDLARLVNHFIPWFPDFISNNWAKTKLISMCVVLAVTGIIIIAGYINSITPVVKEISIRVNKKVPELSSLRIAVASDIHIGNIVNKSRVDKLYEDLVRLEPDIILFPGDILDEDVTPVMRQQMGEALSNLKPRFGVYAITGNHEYIGGVKPTVNYLEKLGIRMVRDEYLLVDNKFFIVGRDDRDKIRFEGANRKALWEVMKGIDKTKPIILMDHQPFKLEEAEKQGVDLQLSGHTHHGQLWPMNFITKTVYELSWGYKQKGNTHYYVSSGYGTWGPPIRIGNTPEIVLININFD